MFLIIYFPAKFVFKKVSHFPDLLWFWSLKAKQRQIFFTKAKPIDYWACFI